MSDLSSKKKQGKKRQYNNMKKVEKAGQDKDDRIRQHTAWQLATQNTSEITGNNKNGKKKKKERKRSWKITLKIWNF